MAYLTLNTLSYSPLHPPYESVGNGGSLSVKALVLVSKIFRLEKLLFNFLIESWSNWTETAFIWVRLPAFTLKYFSLKVKLERHCKYGWTLKWHFLGHMLSLQVLISCLTFLYPSTLIYGKITVVTLDKIFGGEDSNVPVSLIWSLIQWTGLINTHVHTSQQLARGIADDVDLLTWLHGRIWPYESNMTEEDSYLSTLLCGIELIHSGVCHLISSSKSDTFEQQLKDTNATSTFTCLLVWVESRLIQRVCFYLCTFLRFICYLCFQLILSGILPFNFPSQDSIQEGETHVCQCGALPCVDGWM